jgi:hypothetical protein
MVSAYSNPRLVVEGDSLSASGIWVPYALQTASASNTFDLPTGYNQAVGGETALQMMGEIGAVNALNPDVVVLLAGTNDISRGASAITIYGRLKSIWKQYLDDGADYVVAVDVIPRNDPGWMKSYIIKEPTRIFLNILINNYATDPDLANYKDRIHVVGDFGFNPSTDTIDGLHENDIGAQKLGSAIGNVLARLSFSNQAENLSNTDKDLNGDNTCDILWLDAAGQINSWLLNSSGQVTSVTNIGTVGSEWTIQGTGDLNGDGKSDILWRDTTGHVNAWLLDTNGQVTSAPDVATIGSEWSVQGIGDLNGDGRSDILCRDTAGHIDAWLLDASGHVASVANVGTVGPEWTVKGVADLNGDGTSDILWQDTTGHVDEWLMNNSGQVTPTVNIGTVGPEWTLLGTGDFNGDGVRDLLWRDTAGHVNEWLLGSDGQVASAPNIGTIGSQWAWLGTGDYNGDGQSDLLWRDTAGQVNEWLLNGNGQVASTPDIGVIGPEWTIAA